MSLRPGDPGFKEAMKAAFANFAETHVVCREDECQWGFVTTDPDDIDPYTEEPRRTPHDKCQGSGFLPLQMELPFDQA